MKKLIALCLIALVANCAHKHDRNSYKTFGTKVFKETDANGDGVFTKKELLDRNKKSFDKTDANHDCKITREEAKAAGREKQFDEHGKLVKKGYYTCKESFAVQERHFAEADRNHDGKVTKEEHKKYFLSKKGKKDDDNN